MMKMKEYREMSSEELNTELLNLHKERFNLTMQKATGQLVKPHLLNAARKNIARIKTLVTERVGS